MCTAPIWKKTVWNTFAVRNLVCKTQCTELGEQAFLQRAHAEILNAAAQHWTFDPDWDHAVELLRAAKNHAGLFRATGLRQAADAR